MSSTRLNQIEKTSKSIDEAIELALAELGCDRSMVDIEVLEEPAKGFLGIGSKEARVRVTLKNSDPAATAKAFLDDLFLAMGIRVNVDPVMEGNDMNVDLSGDNMGIVIGKRGETLDSLQYLTSLVVNHKSDDYIKVSLDTENYREKRKVALEALADRIASKVERSGRRYIFEPMNPYERRVIHAYLQSSEVVTTHSIGEDPNRKVVVTPKNESRGRK